MRVKLAMTTLCENPSKRTGLSTLFPRFIEEACRCFPEVDWVVFAGPGVAWDDCGGRVELCRAFPANDRPLARLWADHFCVAREARRRGAVALLTVGQMPLLDAGLPVAMQVFSLHHRGGAGLRAWYRGWAVRRGLSKASLVIANSSWLARQLPVDASRLRVSPEGLDHAVFRPEGDAGMAGHAPGYLLWASNFYGYKRAELALAAYAALPEGLRRKHSFVLVGGDWQGGRARAEARARELSIVEQVCFAGWVEDAALPSLYRGARALVLSTAEESFGRSVIEAMACGCPVLVQDLPVMREVAGEAALTVDFAEAGAAARSLERLLVDEVLRERLRGAGLAKAAEYSFERLARERVGAVLAVRKSGNWETGKSENRKIGKSGNWETKEDC
jgi:glycosyltransferase involved in cell wall biosynthesis